MKALALIALALALEGGFLLTLAAGPAGRPPAAEAAESPVAVASATAPAPASFAGPVTGVR